VHSSSSLEVCRSYDPKASTELFWWCPSGWAHEFLK
jgi:hypothetical protein